jgi:ABC-2 type transport system ATP-binding protein
VSIIRAGRVVQSGSLAELRHLTRTTVVVATARPADGLAAMPGVQHVERLDGRVRFDVGTDHLDDVVAYLAEHRVTSLVSHPPTLEELFLRQFGDAVEEPVP